MSNTIVVAPAVAHGKDVTIVPIVVPAVLYRSAKETKAFISGLIGNTAGAFACISPSAARQTFVERSLGLALARMIYGDGGKLGVLELYAKTLPEYKLSKAGEIQGRLGKLIKGYREAVALGAALGKTLDASQDEVPISILLDSPVFGALIAPEVKEAKAKAKDSGGSSSQTVTAPTTTTTTTTTPAPAPAPTTTAPALVIDRTGYTWQGCQSMTTSGDCNPHLMHLQREQEWHAGNAPATVKAATQGPDFVELFGKLAEVQPDQALVMLAKMAEKLGMVVAPVNAVAPASSQEADVSQVIGKVTKKARPRRAASAAQRRQHKRRGRAMPYRL